MKAVLLAGGLGTRLSEETELKPKPMVEIGGHPILWHIMKIYGAHHVNEFVVTLGYKGEVIKRFFREYADLDGDVSVSLSDRKFQRLRPHTDDWTIHLMETGFDTMTGGRLKAVKHLIDDGTFMLTYGDGVSDVDVSRVLDFHRSHGKLATMTAVRPPARFGALSFEGDRIIEFSEKPQAGEGWINGGFFVLEPGVFDFIGGPETIWERAPLEGLAAAGELMAYRHAGFWQCMDTLRDKRLLDSLWSSGKAPWKVWS